MVYGMAFCMQLNVYRENPARVSDLFRKGIKKLV